MSLRDVQVESRDIPIGLIDEPRLTARMTMDEGKLEELASNIRHNGLLEPLVVFPEGERYRVAAGHRRLLASRRAGLVAVPCRVYNTREQFMEAAKHGENRFREEMTAAEEAVYFDELLERDFNGDTDALAAHLGESRSYVESRILLFRGGQDVFDALASNKIGIGVAQELNRCTDDKHRAYLLDCAVRGGATKSVVSGWVQQWQRDQERASGEPAPSQSTYTPAAVAARNYFQCYACKGTERIEAMVPLNFHTYCIDATLEKALTLYEQRGDLLLFPATREQAVSLIERVLARFPELADNPVVP